MLKKESISTTYESIYSLFGKVNGNLAHYILDNLKILLCIIDVQNLKLKWANKFLLEKLGYSFEEITAFSADIVLMNVHSDFQENMLQTIIMSKSEKCSSDNNFYKIKTKDNKWIFILANHSHLENPQKNECNLLAWGIEINMNELEKKLKRIINLDTELLVNDTENKLTCRQKMVLKLIAEGKTDKEIASILNISIHTAKTHRKVVLHKLGFKNSHLLIKFAIENEMD
jgi:DNA-binding CsgD family transcriptional regulator